MENQIAQVYSSHKDDINVLIGELLIALQQTSTPVDYVKFGDTILKTVVDITYLLEQNIKIEEESAAKLKSFMIVAMKWRAALPNLVKMFEALELQNTDELRKALPKESRAQLDKICGLPS